MSGHIAVGRQGAEIFLSHIVSALCSWVLCSCLSSLMGTHSASVPVDKGTSGCWQPTDWNDGKTICSWFHNVIFQ